jgi:RND superfamily putative drug exporter
MSRFFGLGQPRDDDVVGDIESERAALQRSAKELDALKQELAQRVAGVQAKERELAEQLAQVGKGAAEPPADASPAAHDERAAELDALRQQLDAREAAVGERERAVVTRESDLEAREAALVEQPAQPEPEPEPAPAPPSPEPSADELAQIEARLAELRDAENQFARTHAELAARSDSLSEREAAVALREQAVAAREAPRTPELEELESRIRRLEHRSKGRAGTAQSFSSGLRALEQRGVRRSDSPNEPLH